uniref:Uncharacterized protein n=1 Tax=Craspedostauros australis TaxID=1486917 RepID=A0A7R9WZZ0_9STRA|mmetsp:Transcript_5578/g.15138  ORF Transcript_5578/g.15138 Transcript_5578/m.15138 type:complete len:189 (+) Transcript_5578:118-684(+)
MHMWDAELAAQIRIHNIFPPSAPHRLGYHIEGDDYGVACTDDNRCFGLVHISQALEDKGAAPTNNRLLLAGVLIVHFVPASTKITTAQWHTTTNCIPELNPQQRTYATAGLATDQQQQRHAQGGLRSGDDAATQGQLSTNAKSDGDDATNAVEDGATKDIHIDRVYSSVVSLERHGDIDPGNGVGMNI